MEPGLVCLSSDGRIAFRSVTRARFLSFGPVGREAVLREIYWANLANLERALNYCHARNIRLYRMTSALFPLSDYKLGRRILEEMSANLAGIGRRAAKLGIRLVLHPDQFVVLNSESAATRRTSRLILEKHAHWLDLMGLEQSPWNLMNIHGGKGGRTEELIRAIDALPANIRQRLTLENDEYAFSAQEILDVCQATGVPMVFDCHHHVIHEGLNDYDHPSIAAFTDAAAQTWPIPDQALYHISNGHAAFRDRYHAEHITMAPSAFRTVPWLEVEARGKEQAVDRLRHHWPEETGPADDFPLDKPTAEQLRQAAAACEDAAA